MIFVSHRVNSSTKLKKIPALYGIEVDIRSNNGELIISHDPFARGEKFIDWIDSYNHKLLILNVKEEGLEEKLISIMRQKSIRDYFFLDQSFPFLVKWSSLCENRSAIRVSEFEGIETALLSHKIAKWIWLDSFKEFTLSRQNYTLLKDKGFMLCLVSPELQGRTENSDIIELHNILRKRKIAPDAICTKNISLWKSLING